MRRLPRWLRILLGGTALVVAAALILPYFLDLDRYRTLIASVIENETGRKVTIGRIRARLLPSAGFSVEDFHLSNPPGFAGGDLLSAEAIRGNLAWGPLLHRERMAGFILALLLGTPRRPVLAGKNSAPRRPAPPRAPAPVASGAPAAPGVFRVRRSPGRPE
jgi:hypothetical protein